MNLALTLLKEALREWGIGGKTSSGYGRLIESTSSSVAVTRPSPKQKRPFGTPLPLIGSVVDVLVHNDDPKRPQYRWNSETKK